MIRRAYLGSHSGHLSKDEHDPRFECGESVMPLVLEMEAAAGQEQAGAVAWEYQNMGGSKFLTHNDPASWHPHDREGFRNFRALNYLAAPGAAIAVREQEAHPEGDIPPVSDEERGLTDSERRMLNTLFDQMSDLSDKDWRDHGFRRTTFDRLARKLSGILHVTPPAAIPAAPSDDEFEKWLRTVCFQKPTPEAYDLARSAYRHAAALTQPTAVQQADQAYALKWCAAALQAVVAFHGERGSISMFVSGEKKSLEEVLDIADDALKTAQATALPGGNGEGE